MNRSLSFFPVLLVGFLAPTSAWEASSSHNVAITVTAGTQRLGLSPSSLTFASQTTGTSSTAQTVTATNTGTIPFPLFGVAISGTNSSDFSQTNTCSTSNSLAVSATCQVNVVFSPTAAGARTASVVVSATGGGTYTAALSGTGATALPISDSTQRYLVWNEWTFSPTYDLAAFQNEINTVKGMGFNAVRFNIYWPNLETSPNNYAWDSFDARLDYIVQSGLNVIIGLDAMLPTGSNLLPSSELMTAADGSLLIGGVLNNTEISFSSDTAVAHLASIMNAIATRYSARYPQGGVLYYQTAFSPYGETEYFPDPPIMEDYSANAISKFSNWLAQTYGTIQSMNAALSTNFISFSAVQPPTAFSGVFGLAWYQFRSDQLGAAIGAMSDAVKSVNPNLQFGIQLGSVWDDVSNLRGTILVNQLTSKVDWVVEDDAPTYNHRFSVDLLRSELTGKNLGTEIDSLSAPGASDQVYIAQGEQTYESGLRFLSIANWSFQDLTDNAAVINSLTPYLQSGTPAITTSGVMNLSASNMIWNGSDAYVQQYNTLSGNGNTFIDISLLNDLSSQ